MESIPEYDHHLKAQGGRGGKPPWQRERFEGLKQWLMLVALIAAAGGVVWGIVKMYQIATAPKSLKTLKSEAVSPDGKWRALVILHAGRGGVITGVALQDGARKADPNTKPLVYAQEFELPVRLRWDGPRELTIVYPSDATNANVLRDASEYEGIKIKYEGEAMFTEDRSSSTTASGH